MNFLQKQKARRKQPDKRRVSGVGGQKSFPHGSIVPPIPTGVEATADRSAAIDLSWDNMGTGVAYDVYRGSTAPFAGMTKIGSTSSATYEADGLEAETEYFFRVVSTQGGLASLPSDSASATTDAA